MAPGERADGPSGRRAGPTSQLYVGALAGPAENQTKPPPTNPGRFSPRHTPVSLLVAHEHRSPKQLQSVIGHASITLTHDLYGHLLPDSFEGFGAGLDAALAPRGDTAGDTAANLAM